MHSIRRVGLFSQKAHTYSDTCKLKKSKTPTTLNKKAYLKSRFTSGAQHGLFSSFLPDSFIAGTINAAFQAFKY